MPSHAPSKSIIFVALPMIIFSLAYLVSLEHDLKYARGLYEFLAFLLIADLAIGLRGIWRDAAIVIATIILGFAIIEVISAALQAATPVYAHGFSTSRSVLGWGPSTPGVYHSTRIGAGRHVIYSVDYTIDDHLLRQTRSATEGAPIAFFGDSFTFGEGLPDSGALPQIYADLTGHKTRVLNFGFPGYGPQQFLRALEVGLFSHLLTGTKVFVYTTAAWHVERVACLPDFMERAPRYELQNGVPVYLGSCRDGVWGALSEAVIGSAIFQRFVRPIADTVTAPDVELYIAELVRCAEIVKHKYGARLVVLYIAGNDPYLAKSKFTDSEVEARLKKGGTELVDATLSPQSFPPGTSLNILGDGHPTVAANRARAEILQNYLGSNAVTVPR